MFLTRKAFLAIVALLVLIGGCTSAPTKEAEEVEESEEALPDTPAPLNFEYDGEKSPDRWGDLSPEFVLCKTGTRQSPIDLGGPAQQQQDLSKVVFGYQPSKVHITNRGHSIEAKYDPGSFMEVDGLRYDLVQFHFHTPSEHSVRGALSAGELHLVHRNAADGALAVVGVLIDEGPQNDAIQPVLGNKLPAQPGHVETHDTDINAAGLLPAAQATYRYDGSLTTPPCLEGVKWFVMTESIKFSSEQLSILHGIFKHNNRPVQPPNGRIEIKTTTP